MNDKCCECDCAMGDYYFNCLCPCHQEETAKDKELDLGGYKMRYNPINNMVDSLSDETICQDANHLIKELKRLREDKEQIKGCWEAEAEWHVDKYKELQKENARLREEVKESFKSGFKRGTQEKCHD